MRAAFVATRVWKLIMLSRADSTIWHWRIGPDTRTNGWNGKTTVPSGTASTSSENSSRLRYSTNAGSNSGSPSVPRRDRRYAASASSTRRFER